MRCPNIDYNVLTTYVRQHFVDRFVPSYDCVRDRFDEHGFGERDAYFDARFGFVIHDFPKGGVMRRDHFRLTQEQFRRIEPHLATDTRGFLARSTVSLLSPWSCGRSTSTVPLALAWRDGWRHPCQGRSGRAAMKMGPAGQGIAPATDWPEKAYLAPQRPFSRAISGSCVSEPPSGTPIMKTPSAS